MESQGEAWPLHQDHVQQEGLPELRQIVIHPLVCHTWTGYLALLTSLTFQETI